MSEILAFVRIMLRYLRPFWRQSLLFLALMLVDIAFNAAWPLGFKVIIDNVLATRNQRLLAIILGALLGGVLIASAAALGRDCLFAYLNSNLLHEVRVKLFVQLQRLSLDFYARLGSGDILARFSTDMASLETAITWGLASLILNSLTIVVAAILLFTLEWRLALLTVAGLIGCILAPNGFARRAADASYAAKERQAGLANTVQENVHAQPVVKAFGLGPRSADVFRRQSLQLAQAARRFDFLSYIVERLPNVVIMIFEIVVIGAGILLVFYGYRPLGTIVAFHAVFLNITSSVGGLTSILPIVFQSLGGLRRIEEVLNESPKVADIPEAAVLPALSQRITFRDVTFGYTNERASLDTASLEILKGEFVALVGGSGSGKSTLLNLLMRFYDPASGALTVDGHDVRCVTQDSLRSQIGIVFQENVLFNISVRENLRLANPVATDVEIETAARCAEIHDFVMSLPEGYETTAGERGSKFSGGQRQRLALARALLRNPAILLLDEATSALDPATEAAVNETLLRVSHGRTLISATHRLASIAHADRILVLDRGRICEQGRHQELLERNGLYARLWRKQAGFNLNEAGDAAAITGDRLKDIPILSNLSDTILSALAQEFVTERHAADRRVIVEGDPGDRFYIIVRGKVDVTVQRPDGADERVAVLQDGDYFGEIALLNDVPRTASVWTRAPSIFLTLERSGFTELLKRAPQLHESLVQTYLSRLTAPG